MEWEYIAEGNKCLPLNKRTMIKENYKRSSVFLTELDILLGVEQQSSKRLLCHCEFRATDHVLFGHQPSLAGLLLPYTHHLICELHFQSFRSLLSGACGMRQAFWILAVCLHFPRIPWVAHPWQHGELVVHAAAGPGRRRRLPLLHRCRG